MKIGLLGAIITFSGIVFFALSMAIIVLGKKVGRDGTGPQIIKIGRRLEISTSSAIMLVLITACFAFAPYGLTYWKPDLSDYVHPTELLSGYLSLRDMSIEIVGTVGLANGSFADSVNIEVKRTLGDSVATHRYQTDFHGFFDFTLLGVRPEERYAISWEKAGYQKQHLKFDLHNIRLPLVLYREGGN